jgi:hypothetical protein
VHGAEVRSPVCRQLPSRPLPPLLARADGQRRKTRRLCRSREGWQGKKLQPPRAIHDEMIECVRPSWLRRVMRPPAPSAGDHFVTGSVRQQPSTEVWQEPEPPGDLTRCLFLPRNAIRALLELGGSDDTIHSLLLIKLSAASGAAPTIHWPCALYCDVSLLSLGSRGLT